MVRYSILLGGIVLMLGLGGVARAGQAAYPCPSPCPNACVPNVGGFGYYPTKWRQWPGEQRLEVTNPRALGLEQLPTPEGQENLPTPVTSPETPTNKPEGNLVPPGGAILPPQEPAPQQGLPAEPKTPAESGLPGLPVEPAPGVLPGLPDSTPSKEKPKSPSTKNSHPDIQWGDTEHSSAATPFETRKAPQHSTVVLLVDGKDVGDHRADAIVATEPNSSAKARVEAAAFATVESAASAETGSDAKQGAPQVAIGGYCPVDLIRSGRWTPGDLRYTVVHNGEIYRLSGYSQWQEFKANPAAFLPACSGNDPVLSMDEQHLVPGKVMYCATYNGRLYMFSSPASQAKFNQNPQRYEVGK
jgi:YHS domain-containing protein